MEGRKQKRMIDLLNQSQAANLPQGEELQELINDFFIDDPNQSDEDYSEDSDHESEEEMEHDDPSDCDSDEAPPLVDAESDSDFATCVNGAPQYPTLQTAAEFKCSCTQIKVATETDQCAGEKRGCISQFSPQEILALQLSCLDLTPDELDLLVMGIFSSNTRQGGTTECSRRKEQKTRQKPRTSYTMMNRLVCRKTFMFLTGVGEKRLRNLMKHFISSGGPSIRMKKRGGRKNNTKALSLDDTSRIVQFIKNYAEDHAVSLPGRVPGFKRDDILLLPSSRPKSEVHRDFIAVCESQGLRPVSLSTFRKLWATLLPFIVVARPMTDLCWICKSNKHQILRGGILDDCEQQELLMAQQQHLSRVEEERVLYRRMTAECKEVVEQQQITSLGRHQPCSRDVTIHYSFDFAQQVHLPNSPYQPGPIYFLTPRKVGIFGVCCEGLPQQINYLIDEGASSTKGSNAVISYLHHFFDNHGLGERDVQLHCDNCSGQNKNRFVLWYFAWRVMTGRHRSATLNFMPPGHTKFAPDWCFGLLKRKFRQSEVHCLDDLSKVVRKSTPVKKVNIPQIVAQENGDLVVHTYSRQDFFRNSFRTLQGIKKIGHFRFSHDSPGVVFHRETLADQETAFVMVDNAEEVLRDLNDMPAVMDSPGLTRDRLLYLYKHIRPFVSDDAKDILTPNPDV